MKAMILSLFLLPTFALADSVVTPLAPILGPQALCGPRGFNADDSVYGACHTVVAPACSGRGCQPVRTTTNYIVRWDLDGNVTFSQACQTIRHHAPQPDVITYLNGHTAADCQGVVWNPTGSTVTVDGVPYYFVAISSDGLYELVDSAIVQF